LEGFEEGRRDSKRRMVDKRTIVVLIYLLIERIELVIFHP